MEFGQKCHSVTDHLVKSGAFRDEPFSLVDAGCSGGIARFWRIFEPYLQAVGVDPVTTETDRLNSIERNPFVIYVAAFMGLPDSHPFVKQRGANPVTGNNPWDRLSASLGAKILDKKMSEAEKLPILNEWQSTKLADPVRKLHLSELARERELACLDFIKIDIDGYDMDVLLSSEDIIKSAPVLGLALEVNFYGSTRETDHTFHNTDRVMRSLGFELFDLTVRKYSTSTLPQAYEFDCPAQTRRGRPYQGDALYMRDPCSWAYAKDNLVELTPTKLLKLACLFELFTLPDHAAELLSAYSQQLRPYVDIPALLDKLAAESEPASTTFKEHVELFESDPTAFYNSKVPTN